MANATRQKINIGKGNMSRLSLFIYGRLHPRIHRWLNGAGFCAAVGWLYYALVYKQFINRFISGNLQFLDILLGLPLVIALAPVIYALIYWSVKWAVILLYPQGISMPVDENKND